MDVEVTEVVPGELDVRIGERRCRVIVPAGVGIPGVSDEDLAAASVGELFARTGRLPEVIDVSQLLRSDPALLAAIEARLEGDAADH